VLGFYGDNPRKVPKLASLLKRREAPSPAPRAQTPEEMAAVLSAWVARTAVDPAGSPEP
jgi:hypothetical protein